MSLTHVLTPFRIAGLEIPNRVVRNAHHSGFYRTAQGFDATIAYHVERAKGGCGLTILEATAVHPSSRLGSGPGLFEPATLDDLRRLADAVRPYGMRVFQQLWHGGHLTPAFDGGPPIAVSTIAGYTGIVARPATPADIADITEAFGRAALGCRNAGLDGVEIAGAHGYLLSQFLSAFHNDRTDDYGGSFANRARIVLDTLRAVRRLAGADFVLGLRFGPSEATGGISEDDLIALAARVEAEGLADYFNISYGDYYRSDSTAGGMDRPAGYELPPTARLRAAVTLPRIINGRFRTLAEADQEIRHGEGELVGLTRPQIADPMLVAKTRVGRPEEVRPCIACNQGCLGGIRRSGVLGCTVNPAVGLESSLSESLILKTANPLRVLIAGGGPAGMEAARVAALTGHRVVLAEAGAQLGGMVRIARKAPFSAAIGDIAHWLEQEVYRLGVEVRLSSYVEAEEVLAERFDAVVVATGSIARKDGYQPSDPGQHVAGVELPHVLSSVEALTGAPVFGANALVLDTVGHMEGAMIAEYLLGHGARVTFVSTLPGFALAAQQGSRDNALFERLHRAGEFSLLLRHELIEIGAASCVVRPLFDTQNRRARTMPADTVVLVTQNQPLRSLYDDLRGRQARLALIGDALSPRDLQVAIAEGHGTGRALFPDVPAPA